MKVHDYPAAIERLTLTLATTCGTIAETRDRLKDAELDALDLAIKAREDDRPLYTSDRARDLAAHRTLKASTGYQQDRATLRTLEHTRAVNEAEIDKLRRELRLAVIDYELQRLGRRDAA
jgi:hypothetical protein